jgi:hypothetical protein
VRSYIFTPEELNVIQEYLRTGKRSAAFNKLLHLIRHNSGRILEDLQLFLTLLELAHKRKEERLSLPPGRPDKKLETAKTRAKDRVLARLKKEL